MAIRKYKIRLYGYDEFGRFQSEIIKIFEKPVTSENAYATLGFDLPEDFIPKIGEWFWNDIKR